MSIEELCALPVSEIAEKDCALFLWATFPQLKEALQLIKAWGFQYKTVAFVWLKTNKKADTCGNLPSCNERSSQKAGKKYPPAYRKPR